MWVDNKQVCQADGHLAILNAHLKNNQIVIVDEPVSK